MVARRRGGGSAVLSLLLASVLVVVLAAPFGSATTPGQASTGRGGATAPGVEAGLLGHPAALGLPPRVHLTAARTALIHGTPMPWVDTVPRAGGAADAVLASLAPPSHDAPAGGATERSWWGRAPPHTPV